MAAMLTTSIPRPRIDEALSQRDRARDFVSIDCAVWISRIMSAVQRQDPDAIAHFCRSMRDTLRALGATAALGTTVRLEAGCRCYSRAMTFAVFRRLMRDVTRLVDRLHAQLSDPAWCAPPAPRVVRVESQVTSRGAATCIARIQLKRVPSEPRARWPFQ
ncbi:MAG: hypothetical protein HY898_15760 [Deltaproteobacteria bacterium]|nr:hypothetical protein [Deltaproteobacteria bacterium]